jgi:hypothetical protein
MLVEGSMSMPALLAMSVRSSSVQLLYGEPDLDNVQPVMMVWQSDLIRISCGRPPSYFELMDPGCP